MRKIESLMNAAITDNTTWSMANTAVTLNAEGESEVFLHGNLIARIGENFVQLFDGGWQTVTTKSRLNAICAAHAVEGEGVFQEAGEWFCRQWDNAMGWQVVPFESGMVLR
tara:strand:+ start:485 stop:817 length:333 start_codon:yes stop_codon:yes gene_type:complete